MDAKPDQTDLFDARDRASAITALHMMLEDGPTSFIPSEAQALAMAAALDARGWPDLAALCRAWATGADYSWPKA